MKKQQAKVPNVNWPMSQHGSLTQVRYSVIQAKFKKKTFQKQNRLFSASLTQLTEHWILCTVFRIHAFQSLCWSKRKLKLQSFTILFWSNCLLHDVGKVHSIMVTQFMCLIRKSCRKHWWWLNSEQAVIQRNWISWLTTLKKSFKLAKGMLVVFNRVWIVHFY